MEHVVKTPVLLVLAWWLACVPQSGCAAVFEVGEGGALIEKGGVGTMADSAGTMEGLRIADLPAKAITMIGSPRVPVAFRQSLGKAADRARISPDLLAALVSQESGWRASAVSPKGARGLTQLMPRTALALTVDPDNAVENLAGGARYLRVLLNFFDGDVQRALAAYNAGPFRVLRSPAAPPFGTTRAYVASIFERLNQANLPHSGAAKP